MKSIHIDLECHSSADLSKCGVYRYTEAEDFEILLFGCSVDGGPVCVIDLASGEVIPDDILHALEDDSVLKYAHNAAFERICLSRYLYGKTGVYLSPFSWRCTMVMAAYHGLPLSLEAAGSVLGLDKGKMTEGKELIRYFCVPCKPTKANGGRTRNLPHHAPDKWAVFKQYNARDVEVELSIQERLSKFPVPDFVWEEYRLDQEVNDRGVMIDRIFVEQALRFDALSRADLTAEMKEKTGLLNPNSVVQMKQWLSDNGLTVESLGKKDIAAILKTAPPGLQPVLHLRQQLARSSVKKYQAMQNAVCGDDRCRGMFQFYGANRSGRFCSKIVQLQNLVQNHLPDLDQARALVRDGNYDALAMLYDDIPDTLSQLIRTAFVPQPGCRFFVADFSAIEARVLSWLAGEQWRIDLFHDGGDIYCQSASHMFKVPVVKHGVNGELRQRGKIAELACIARDSPVLTDHGLVPIQCVTKDMRLWDGVEWVTHGGVVFKGTREVITYDGLTATPDHLVWVRERSEPVRLGTAVSEGLKLLITGKSDPSVSCPRYADVYDILDAGPRHRFTVSGHLVHNCGYGGGTGALKNMGAMEMGLSEEEMKDLVKAWRDANPHIVQFWHDVDDAAITAVRDLAETSVGDIRFSCHSKMLFITLPSGRSLAYVRPELGMSQYGGTAITYEGIGATKKWERLETRGAKIVENITQAISRDILCCALRNLSGYRIVMHVHDEVVIEAPCDADLKTICEIMSRSPPWAEGLELRADGYICDYYRKD